MRNLQFHEQHPDAYDDGHLEAIGALIGWMGAKREPAPTMTDTLREALAHMTACAFNAGFRAGRKAPR